MLPIRPMMQPPYITITHLALLLARLAGGTRLKGMDEPVYRARKPALDRGGIDGSVEQEPGGDGRD